MGKIIWEQDDVSNQCNGCNEPFTIWKRRHHCRACGKLRCANCTDKTIPLPFIGYYNPVRVCHICYNKYDTLHSTLIDSKNKHYQDKKNNTKLSNVFNTNDFVKGIELVEKYMEYCSNLKHERNYFVRSEIINWFLDCGFILNRSLAVDFFQKMVENKFFIKTDFIDKSKQDDLYTYHTNPNDIDISMDSPTSSFGFYTLNKTYIKSHNLSNPIKNETIVSSPSMSSATTISSSGSSPSCASISLVSVSCFSAENKNKINGNHNIPKATASLNNGKILTSYTSDDNLLINKCMNFKKNSNDTTFLDNNDNKSINNNDPIDTRPLLIRSTSCLLPLPQKIYSETRTCSNCHRRFLAEWSCAKYFCSLDCKANAVFQHYDTLYARKICRNNNNK